MSPPRFAILISLAALAGCATGSTLRVAEEDTSTTTGEPVALAPAPEPEPAAAAPAPMPAAASDTTPSVEQGYAPYGTSRDLEVRRVGQWAHSAIDEARRMVIRDANGWAEFWPELGTGERPDVDFTQNVVIAASAGQRTGGGYEIEISRVTEADGQLTIEVVETTPGPNCVTTAAITRPADVVVVPAVAPRGWSFLERKEIRACR